MPRDGGVRVMIANQKFQRVAACFFGWMMLHGTFCWIQRYEEVRFPPWYGFSCFWIGVVCLLLLSIAISLSKIAK